MLSYWRATDFPCGSETRLRQKGNSIYHQQLLTMEDHVICAKGNATCSFTWPLITGQLLNNQGINCNCCCWLFGGKDGDDSIPRHHEKSNSHPGSLGIWAKPVCRGISGMINKTVKAGSGMKGGKGCLNTGRREGYQNSFIYTQGNIPSEFAFVNQQELVWIRRHPRDVITLNWHKGKRHVRQVLEIYNCVLPILSFYLEVLCCFTILVESWSVKSIWFILICCKPWCDLYTKPGDITIDCYGEKNAIETFSIRQAKKNPRCSLKISWRSHGQSCRFSDLLWTLISLKALLWHCLIQQQRHCLTSKKRWKYV